MRKLYKAVAVLMALAMLAGLALADGVPEVTDMELEDTVDLEIGEVQMPDAVDEIPGNIELALEEIELKGNATYRFIVEGVEVASQVAFAGEEIRRPEAPEAPSGKAFAGWALADGTPLFVNADGENEPVIVQDNELGTEVCVWAVFVEAQLGAEGPGEEPAGEEPVEQKPAEEEPAEEEPAGEAAEAPADEQPAAAGPVANALVYNGEAQALVSAGEGWLFSTDGETYTPEIPTATDAGEYTVYFAPADAEGEAQALVVTVAKADVVLVPPEALTGEA